MLYLILFILSLIVIQAPLFTSASRPTSEEVIVIFAPARLAAPRSTEAQEAELRALAHVKTIVARACQGKSLTLQEIYDATVEELVAELTAQIGATSHSGIDLRGLEAQLDSDDRLRAAEVVDADEKERLVRANTFTKKSRLLDKLLSMIPEAEKTQGAYESCKKAVEVYLAPTTDDVQTQYTAAEAEALIPDTTPEQKVHSAVREIGERGELKHGRFYQLVYAKVHPDKLKPLRLANTCAQLLARLKPASGKEGEPMSAEKALALLDTYMLSEKEEHINNDVDLGIQESTRQMYIEASESGCPISGTLKEFLSLLCTMMEEGKPGALAREKNIANLQRQAANAAPQERASFQEAVEKSQAAVLGMRVKLRKLLQQVEYTNDTVRLSSPEEFNDAFRALVENTHCTVRQEELANLKPLSPEEERLYRSCGLKPLLRQLAASIAKVAPGNPLTTARAIIRAAKVKTTHLPEEQREMAHMLFAEAETLDQSGELQKMLEDAVSSESKTTAFGASKLPLLALGAFDVAAGAYLMHLRQKERTLTEYIDGLARDTHGRSIVERLAVIASENDEDEARTIRELKEEFKLSSPQLRKIRRAIKERQEIKKQKKIAAIALFLGLAGTAFAAQRLRH